MEATPDSVAFSLKVRHAILVDRKFSKSGIQEIIYERTVNFPGGFAFNFQAEKEGRFSTFSLRLQNCGEESVKIIDFKMGRFPIRNLGFLMKPGESLEVTDQLTYHQDSAKSIRIECLLEFESGNRTLINQSISLLIVFLLLRIISTLENCSMLLLTKVILLIFFLLSTCFC